MDDVLVEGVVTFLIKQVYQHEDDKKPVILTSTRHGGFYLLWRKNQSKHEHVLAKSGIKNLNILPNRYTVYLYSICVRS